MTQQPPAPTRPSGGRYSRSAAWRLSASSAAWRSRGATPRSTHATAPAGNPAYCAAISAAIRRFGARKKLFFSHFRDVRGSVPAFEETFHDEGKTDMAACIRAYADIGYDGPMRPDHAPTSAVVQIASRR